MYVVYFANSKQFVITESEKTDYYINHTKSEARRV